MLVNLAELRAAHNTGELDHPEDMVLILDNDQCAAYDRDGNAVFDAHPSDVLRDALDLLGIAWANV